MRYRPLSPTGDYTLGQAFYANNPQAVAQAIFTRLKLWQGEWFVDVTDGTAWNQQVLGKPIRTPDLAIRERILGTPGVQRITAFSSVQDPIKRTYTVTASVQTIYGAVTVTVPLGTNLP